MPASPYEPARIPEKKAPPQEPDLSKLKAQILMLNTRLEKLEGQDYLSPILELRSKLKETIRAVERLAGGRSLGNLGLPTEESWQKSTL